MFLKLKRPKTDDLVIKIFFIVNEKLKVEISLFQLITKNYLILHILADLAFQNNLSNFYLFPPKNLHFLSGQGFPLPLLSGHVR